MSFIIDLPTLIFIGAALYFVGKKYELERLSKITIAVLIILCFVLPGLLLYFDIFKCIFPWVCYCPDCPNSASDFMLNFYVFGNYHRDTFPFIFVIILFLLYPVAIYIGYAFALLYTKWRDRKILLENYSYDDVKSRAKISKIPKYKITRYPDSQNDTNNLKEAVEAAVDGLGGMKRFVSPGDKVLIKVNICGGNPENSASYTSIDVADYVVDMVRQAGGEPMICDADIIWTKFWETAKPTGWVEWAKKKKVDLINLSETDLAYFNFGEGTTFQDNENPNMEIVSKKIIDADVIICIPKMKTHLITGVTLGMKNMYGTLPEIDKARYHQRGIEEVIYWINYAFPPTLTIIDGSTGGEAIGPLSVNSVQYNTIIASNNVALADAIASKLIGFEDPFKEIKNLRIASEKMAQERSLISKIHTDLYLTAQQIIAKNELPTNPKDGNWDRPDPKVVEQYSNFIKNILAIPGIDTFSNIGADFIIFDAAKIPLLKYLDYAILKFLLEVPRPWVKRTPETTICRNRMKINLAFFSLIAIISLFYFFVNEYHWTTYFNNSGANWTTSLAFINAANWTSTKLNNGHLWIPPLKSIIWIVVGIILALILGAWFAKNMNTRHLLAITFSSMIVAYFVESWAPNAKWWIYPHEDLTGQFIASVPWMHTPPLYPLFAVPIFIIGIIGISRYFRPVFEYVGLKGKRFRLAPYSFIIIAIFLLLNSEKYLNLNNPNVANMAIIYTGLAILALYYNERQNLDWNLTIAVIAVALGFFMEYFGALAGFWGPPQSWLNPATPVAEHRLPMFIGLTWALNTWAACGLAQIFGINLYEAFVKDDAFDASDPVACRCEGDSMLARGKCEEAIKHYDNAINILSNLDNDKTTEKQDRTPVDTTPHLADAWYGKGNALASLGDFKNSIKAYNEAIDLYNKAHTNSSEVKMAQACYRKAVTIQNLEGPDKALDAYDQAKEVSKGALRLNLQAIDIFVDICIDKALALQQLGRFDKSIKELEQTIASIKKDYKGDSSIKIRKQAELYDFEGFAYLDEAEIIGKGGGYYEEAIKCFEHARKLSSKDADRTWLASALWGTGIAQAKLDNYVEAIEAIDESIIELDQRNAAFVYCDKGDILLDRENDKKHKEALEAYNKVIELYPEFNAQSQRFEAWRRKGGIFSRLAAKAWQGKGDAHSMMQEQEDYALKAYRRSIDMLDKSMNNSDDWSGKGYILGKMGRHKEANMAYKNAINMAQKAYDNAVKTNESPLPFITAISLAKAWTGIGNILIALGDHAIAKDAFSEAIKKCPCYQPAWQKMTGLLKVQGVPKDTLKTFKQTLDKSIEKCPCYMPEWQSNKGLLKSQGEPEDVLDGLENKAIKTDPRHGEIWQHRGEYLGMMRYENDNESG